jgi:hypothetical protein
MKSSDECHFAKCQEPVIELPTHAEIACLDYALTDTA